MLKNISTSVVELTAAEDIRTLEESLTHAVRDVGFVTFNISLNKRHAEEFMEDPTLTTWSQRDLDLYMRDGWANRDPLLHNAVTASSSFLWCADDWNAKGFHEYAEYLDISGLSGGATIPLNRPTGQFGAMTLLAVDQKPLTDDALQATQILAHMAMARASALTERIATSGGVLRRIRLLSKHQLEILRWVARGKTNREIAIILGSTRRTIDYHMQQILNKLEVSSRAQAVAVFASAEP
ncbi:helix-turn-helix transcriptional regulator [Pseudodonghicola xiamenensis]|uniref:HTH luxR-type domain-containing protein n=1 Tax=Pseudodonghicola xiamenensis TaxID=337702 RepID=A0A8J3MFM1_9RHOB|nr:LuxR family transcriptional regulator [Pseudodonghicola xiamenensis]GHH05987.1 hypothetical protein GCM10010961_44920 [Pseudodonghicola xiamenensis]